MRLPGCSNGLQNARVAPFVWGFVAVPALMAIVFYDQTLVLRNEAG